MLLAFLASLISLGLGQANSLVDWAVAGTPQSYTPYSTPYTGAEQWYCSRSAGSDGSCNVSGIINSTPFGNSQFTTNQGLSIGITGLDASGANDNATIIQNALTAIASGGGSIHLPCGQFKVLSSFSLSYTGHIDFSGSGACTRLYFQGATQGITFTWGSGTANLHIHDMEIVTNDTGGSYTALTLINHFGTFGVAPDATQGNMLENLWFYGNDRTTGTGSMYWGQAIIETNISALTLLNVNITGIGSGATYHGNGVSLNGYNTGANYSVVINFVSVNMYRVSQGVFYGDYVQGVTAIALNITNCGTGIETVASPAGILSELDVVNSQFGACNIGYHTSSSGNAMQTNFVANTFIISAANEIAMQPGGTGLVLLGNTFESSSASSTSAIDLSVAAASGLIGENFMTGFENGVKFGNLSSFVRLNYNVNTGNTKNYNTSGISSLGGYIINDDIGYTFATLPTCTNFLLGSRFLVTDMTAPTYNGAITNGGSVRGLAVCTFNGSAGYRSM